MKVLCKKILYSNNSIFFPHHIYETKLYDGYVEIFNEANRFVILNLTGLVLQKEFFYFYEYFEFSRDVNLKRLLSELK